MNNYQRRGLCVLVWVFVSVLFIPLRAQNGVTVKPLPSRWQLPALPCADTESCQVLARVDKNGVLYMNDMAEAKLYIAQPDGSPHQTIDLTASKILASFVEFIPFEDGSIFFETYPVYPSRGLYLYNYQTDTLTQLNPPVPGRVKSCTGDPYVITHSFSRLGDTGKQIIVCSISNDNVYNINVVDVTLQTLEETVSTTDKSYPRPPWQNLQGGHDGNVYIQVSLANWLPFLDGLITPNENVYSYIAKHTPGTPTWSVIPISKTILEHVPSSEKPQFYLVGIDVEGNLYFSLQWMADRNLHSEILKLNPQGEMVWKVTEAELGGVRYFTDLLKEDHFFTSTVVSTNHIREFLVESISTPQKKD